MFILLVEGDECGMAQQESFKALAAKHIVLRHVVTHGDSATFKAAEDVYLSSHSSTDPM